MQHQALIPVGMTVAVERRNSRVVGTSASARTGFRRGVLEVDNRPVAREGP